MTWTWATLARANGTTSGTVGAKIRRFFEHGHRRSEALETTCSAEAGSAPPRRRPILDRLPHAQHVARADLLDLRLGVATPQQLADQVGIHRRVLEPDRQPIDAV